MNWRDNYFGKGRDQISSVADECDLGLLKPVNGEEKLGDPCGIYFSLVREAEEKKRYC